MKKGNTSNREFMKKCTVYKQIDMHKEIQRERNNCKTVFYAEYNINIK
jgi:hypothetical protein